jgi:hypothetical protein
MAAAGAIALATAEGATNAPAPFVVPAAWEYTAPLITPERREQEPSRAQKDPTLATGSSSVTGATRR